MRKCAFLTVLLVLLAAVPTIAGGELPKALRPGASAVFTRKADGETLGGAVRFRVEEGEEGTVRLIREYDTGDVGPLTFRDRLTALLDVETRRVRSFVYEGAGGKADLLLLSRMGPDPEREGRFLHERFKYDAEGGRKRVRTRLKLDEAFVPDLLEPFLAGLTDIPAGEKRSFRLLTVTRGRLIKKPVDYRALGEGKMELDDDIVVPCRILNRTRSDESQLIYLRAADGMPLSFGPLRITVKEEPR